MNLPTSILTNEDRAKIVMSILDAFPRAVAGTINFADESPTTAQLQSYRDLLKTRGEQWLIYKIRETMGWNGMTHEAGASTKYQNTKRFISDHTPIYMLRWRNKTRRG